MTYYTEWFGLHPQESYLQTGKTRVVSPAPNDFDSFAHSEATLDGAVNIRHLKIGEVQSEPLRVSAQNVRRAAD